MSAKTQSLAPGTRLWVLGVLLAFATSCDSPPTSPSEQHHPPTPALNIVDASSGRAVGRAWALCFSCGRSVTVGEACNLSTPCCGEARLLVTAPHYGVTIVRLGESTSIRGSRVELLKERIEGLPDPNQPPDS